MSSPVQFRWFMRKFTIDDARNGVTPQSLPTGPIVNGQAPRDLFCPPVLQFRSKEKVHLNGAPALEWSDWQNIGYVKDGDEPIIPE